MEFFRRYSPLGVMEYTPIDYVEPDLTSKPGRPIETTTAAVTNANVSNEGSQKQVDKISSKVVILGDFIDTDAVCSTTCKAARAKD